MPDEQLQQEHYNVIVDIWKAMKPRIASVNQSAAYWEDAIQIFSGIAKKYEGTEAGELAGRMSVAAVAALEDRYRRLFGISTEGEQSKCGR